MTEYVVDFGDTSSAFVGLAMADAKRHGASIGEPVVRCRDCVHYTDDKRYLGLGGECRMAGIGGAVFVRSVGPDGYCAWGERRVS